MKIRHQKHLRVFVRPITKRMIDAEERALKKQRDSMPLFREQIAAEQPTAVERLEDFQGSSCIWQQEQRDSTAKLWREIRRKMSDMPDDRRELIIGTWNDSGMPGTPSYFMCHIRTIEETIAQQMAKGKRWFVVNVQGHVFSILWESDRPPPTVVAGPFETYIEARDARANY